MDRVEDYEYFVIFRRILGEKGDTLGEEERARSSGLLEVPEAMSKSMTEFTQRPVPMEAHREALARAIEMLSGGATG